MRHRVPPQFLAITVLVILAAAQAHAGTAPAGGGDPGVLPTQPTLGPMEFVDDFDSYAAGSDMHGQGGWKGWDNNPGAGALVTSDLAHTVPNSVDVNGGSDLVHEFAGFASGVWTLSAWTYIPAQSSTTSYFIALNTYADRRAVQLVDAGLFQQRKRRRGRRRGRGLRDGSHSPARFRCVGRGSSRDRSHGEQPVVLLRRRPALHGHLDGAREWRRRSQHRGGRSLCQCLDVDLLR